MLAHLSPEELAEARAAKEVVPLDDGWKQAGTIAATVHNELTKYMFAKAGKARVDKSEWFSADDYIPKIREPRKSAIRVNQASIDMTESIIANHFAR